MIFLETQVLHISSHYVVWKCKCVISQKKCRLSMPIKVRSTSPTIDVLMKTFPPEAGLSIEMSNGWTASKSSIWKATRCFSYKASLCRIHLYANFMMNLKPVHGFCLKQNAVIQITSFIIHFTKLYLSFESIENRWD